MWRSRLMLLRAGVAIEDDREEVKANAEITRVV
jgi:hypothetical protein